MDEWGPLVATAFEYRIYNRIKCRSNADALSVETCFRAIFSVFSSGADWHGLHGEKSSTIIRRA